ncbi:unnamed protein product, partial [Ectocarpus sp. 12 AP-2014]
KKEDKEKVCVRVLRRVRPPGRGAFESLVRPFLSCCRPLSCTSAKRTHARALGAARGLGFSAVVHDVRERARWCGAPLPLLLLPLPLLLLLLSRVFSCPLRRR